MAEKISSYTSIIVCTIMFSIIIKMIIPEGKNKKYILFVCGLITTLVIIEPLLNLMNIDVNEVLAKNEEEYKSIVIDESLYKNTINESYEKALIEDITNRLKENGYDAKNIKVEYGDTYNLEKIYLDIEEKSGYVQPIKIEVSNNSNSSEIGTYAKNKIREIISSNYGVKTDDIYIEGSNK